MAKNDAASSVEIPGEPTGARWWPAALIVLVSMGLNLVGNGRMSLFDRDEPRYATCTREMRLSGDWIRPTFNGEPRHQKPILIYWLMLASTSIAGDNPFGARLVSAIAGTATCLLVWAWGRRMFGPNQGLLAAMILASAPIVVAESKLATTDATLAFLVVAGQFALWELNRRESAAAIIAFWASLSLAILTKGPIGPAMIAISGLFSWWWGGPTVAWARLRWRRGLIGVTLVTAPWYLAIAILSRGDFFREAVGRQLVSRLAMGLDQHGAIPGYYVVTSLIAFFPWSALLPAAIVAAWLRRRSNPDLAFLLGWVVGPWIMLECVRTKLVHYYLPSFPACALLIAWSVVAVAESGVNLRRWPLGRVSLALMTSVGLASTVALLAGALIFPSTIRWPALAIAAILASGTLFAMERFARGRTERAAWGLVTMSGLVMAVAGGWFVPAAEPLRTSTIVAGRLRELSALTGATPMLGEFQEPSVVYAFGRPIEPMRSMTNLVDRAKAVGLVAAALEPKEIKAIRAEPRLTIDLVGSLGGYNLNKGRADSFELVLIRPAAPRMAARIAPRTREGTGRE